MSNEYRLLKDKLRKRGQDFVALMHDPADGGTLQAEVDTLVNPLTNQRYVVDDTIIKLALPDQLVELEQQTKSHADKAASRGWLPPDIVEFRRLPQTPIPTWPDDYWNNRAVVIAEMWRILEEIRIAANKPPIGAIGTAVDISDALGWVGYGLDVAGYNTIVVSRYSGPHGLGAFPYSRYVKIQSDITAPPLQSGKFDLVTVSFCIHDVDDAATLLDNTARLLKQNGVLLVLSADEIDVKQISTILASTGLQVEERTVGAMGSTIGRAVKNLLRRAPNVPPIIIGRRLP